MKSIKTYFAFTTFHSGKFQRVNLRRNRQTACLTYHIDNYSNSALKAVKSHRIAFCYKDYTHSQINYNKDKKGNRAKPFGLNLDFSIKISSIKVFLKIDKQFNCLYICIIRLSHRLYRLSRKKYK